MNKIKGLSLLRLIAAFFVAVSFFWLIKLLSPGLENLSISFTLGFLLVVGFIAGKIFSQFFLPELSGFLFVGMLCGPSGISIITASEINSLTPLNELALALIAVQAGSEILLSFLKKGIKSISLVILCQSLIIFFGMTAIFLFAIYYLGFDIGQSNLASLAAALIFATISISKAPADTLAILGETKLKGDFANHCLGVVVLIDILVIVLFQLVLLLVKPLVVVGAFVDFFKAINLFEELLSSVAAGFSLGILFILWFSLKKYALRESILFLILASFGVASMCHYLRYDALIVFLVGGFIVSNMSKEGHQLIDTVQSISHGVMIVFFATAGAMLDIEVLKVLWPYALLFSVARIIFTMSGTWLGHYLAKDDFNRYKYSFSAYISQAGVTLVLAQSAARVLGEVGLKIAALATAVVAINEIIGPIAFKLSIRREQKRFSKPLS